MVQKKYSEKATSQNKPKGNKEETRLAIGGPAHRRAIEQRAAGFNESIKTKNEAK